MRINKSSLKFRLILAISTVLVSLVLVCVVGYLGITKLYNSSDKLTKSTKLIEYHISIERGRDNIKSDVNYAIILDKENSEDVSKFRKSYRERIAYFNENLQAFNEAAKDYLDAESQEKMTKVGEAYLANGEKLIDLTLSMDFQAFEIMPIYNKLYDELLELNNGIGKKLRQQTNAISAENADTVASSKRNLIIFSVIGFLLSVLFAALILRQLHASLSKLTYIIDKVSKGDLDVKVGEGNGDEIDSVIKSMVEYIKSLKQASEFSNEIGNGNYDVEFVPLSENDGLGNSLIGMRENLKLFKEENTQRNWATAGLAKFADILRANNDDLDELTDKILSNLVKYVGANQGSIFVIEEEGQEKVLELKVGYAWNRKKHNQKTILLGEGLVGRCWQEASTIYLTDVPSNYISITSGLGDASPTAILIIPMKIESEVYGVIEIASFKELASYEIEFIEKLAESIASTIGNTKVNIRTARLLEESKEMTEQMQAQEEEIRQNMEEMQATQEEMERVIQEKDKVIEGLKT